jgi:shikimate kinase/3-dehydroquinate synthase
VTQRIVLIGLSGAGKSTVARALGERLGWSFADTDDGIVGRFGQPIADIFRDHGEAAFRAVERELLEDALSRKEIVVATGGGAVVDPRVWESDLLGGPQTLVVALEVSPAVALARLQEQQSAEGTSSVRPLLAGTDPLGRLEHLKSARQEIYDRGAITIIVDAAAPEEIAAEIAGLTAANGGDGPDITLEAQSGSSDIYLRSGVVQELGALARARWPKARRAWIVTDEHVGHAHGDTVASVLTDAGFDADRYAVPAGEGSKSLEMTGELLDWLLRGGIERSDIVVALGGGVVGDLAGFVAAICLRGVPLIQVPTTLLAMVDSSVGGKTAVNHPTGKNLIGVFYQPPLVVIDPRLLQTLPPRELRSGWGEIVKHAVIQPSTPHGDRGDLLPFLDRNQERLDRLQDPAITYAIRRNVALKAAVVAADEREAGVRSLLNFGHTLGHAIEAAGYRLLHGEAISVGMVAASEIGRTVGTCSQDTVDRIAALIRLFGLPTSASVDSDLVMQLIQSDKKKSGGKLRWVLPLDGGGVVLRSDIPESAVLSGLAAVNMG